MRAHGAGYRTSVFLPPHLAAAIRALADRDFGGNVSAAIQWAIEQADVTKSGRELPCEATASGLP